MGDSDSLVDDPHEGWVIPYDQAEELPKQTSKQVSIAGQTNKPTGHSSARNEKAALSQNMEDTRL